LRDIAQRAGVSVKIASRVANDQEAGVLDKAALAGYNVFVCNTDGNPEQEIRILYSFTDHAVDGIIVFPSFENEDFLLDFAGQGSPMVCVNRPFESAWVSRVMIRSRVGARLAVRHG
jgi:DNA-binding LacI/PurR family transcriptional regulator